MLKRRIAGFLSWAGVGLVVVTTVQTTDVPAAGQSVLDKTLRPTTPGSYFAFTKPAFRYRGQSVVVHYVRRGIDAPPRPDKNHNGVPDYVELVAELADYAIGFYKLPYACVTNRCFPPMRPFRAPRPDAAGPDGKPDIYLKGGLGDLGRTIPPSKGEGGAFILLRPSLDQQRTNPRNGLYMIVPHEVFHLVEYAYVPNGAPRWISEGVANLMAAEAASAWYVAHHINISSGTADRAVQAQFDLWLKKPWLSIFSNEFTCDRCYGTLVWWSRIFASHNELQRFFELLARRPNQVGLGVALLDQAIRETGGLFDENSLADALGNFWEELYRADPVGALAYEVAGSGERAVGPSGPTSRLEPPPAGFMTGLSAHFIRLIVPAEASGVRVVLDADAGLEPRLALYIGGNFLVSTGNGSRRVDPLRTDPVDFAGRPGKAITLEASFQSGAEREPVVLMIVNRRTSGMPYRIRYAATGPASPAGRYCGITEVRGPDFCFDRSPDGRGVSEFRSYLRVGCTPEATFFLPVALHPLVPTDARGRFTAHYTISGNGSGIADLQGAFDSEGRASGTIQMVKAAFDSQGTHYECTGKQTKWTARSVQ